MSQSALIKGTAQCYVSFNEYLWSSSDGEPGVFDGSVITCFLLCVRIFPIEQVRFLDICSNMAGINNNNNFELFTFMNEFMLDDTDDEFFVLYTNNSILGWDCTM